MRTDSGSDGQKERSFIEGARRAQIVEAAAEVVAEVGYAQTSFARIAERAGISKGVITYHFTNKDEILRLVASRFFERGWEYMEPQVEAETTALGKLTAWLRSQIEFFGAHRTEFIAMSDIMSNHRSLDGTYAYAEDLEQELEAFAELLTWGQQTGEFRDFEVRTVASIILRSSDGVLESWVMDPTVDLVAYTDALLDFVERAIRKDLS